MSEHHPRPEPSSDETAATDTPRSASSRLFDLRILIGGLFTFYGIVLVIYGFFTGDDEIAKSAGIHINLWLGVGMLALGLVFLLWARLAPVVHDEPSTGR